MLIIAIAYGSVTDPFTTSVSTRTDYCLPEPIDCSDPKACLAYICKEKNLQPDWIDEILVVDQPDYDVPSEVIYQYSEKLR